MTSIYRRVSPEPQVSGAALPLVSQLLWAAASDSGAGPRGIWFPLPADWRREEPGNEPLGSSRTGAFRAPNGAKVLISRTATAVSASRRTVTRGVLGRDGGHFVLTRTERLWGLLPPWHELAVDWPAPTAGRFRLTLRSSDEGALRQILPWLSRLRCGRVRKAVRPARRLPGSTNQRGYVRSAPGQVPPAPP